MTIMVASNTPIRRARGGSETGEDATLASALVVVLQLVAVEFCAASGRMFFGRRDFQWVGAAFLDYVGYALLELVALVFGGFALRISHFVSPRSHDNAQVSCGSLAKMNPQPAQSLTIRRAERKDAALMLKLVHELATYEREPDAVMATEADLLRDGFGEAPLFHCLIAEWEGEAVGFALFFYNYSTWHGRPGIHLEDLFVRETQRGKGIGKALLKALAKEAIEKGCTRLNWHVLDWNQPAIDFYKRMGADVLPDWRICRVSGDALAALASASSLI
jgi:GNAT superfamily N-acetyltransferase